jgi:hypothetical protein
MRLEIENIEEMRCRVGIDDVELKRAIRGLRIGDYVNLTLLAGTKPSTGKTLLVRITNIKGSAFRGKLADRLASLSLPGLRPGSRLAFTADHIHSLPEGRRTHAP